MCFLEKAMAKLMGNYAQMNGGLVSTGWIAMTGCQDVANYNGNGKTFKKARGRYDIQNLHADWGKPKDLESGEMNAEQFFQLLHEFDSKNYLMCAGIIAKKNPNLKENMVEGEEGTLENGLYTKHAYAILSAYEGHGVQLFRMRNPWGTHREYNGDWCDQSEKWKEFPEAKPLRFPCLSNIGVL